MNLVWLTTILLTLSWYPLTAFYAPANIHYTTPLWFVIAALFSAVPCGAVSRPFIQFSITRKQGFAWLGATLVFVVLLPLPYALPGFFFLAALGIGLIPPRDNSETKAGALDRIRDSLFLCGCMTAAQAALLPFFVLFASRFHGIDSLAPVMAFFIKLLGVPTAYSNGELFVQNADRVMTFIPSWEMLAHYAMLNILICGVFLLLIFRMPGKSYFKLFAILFLYMLARAVIMVLSYSVLNSPSVFWRLDLLALSLLPLFFVLQGALPLGSRDAVRSIHLVLPSGNKPVLVAALLFAVSIMCWAGFFGFVDPGTKKPVGS